MAASKSEGLLGLLRIDVPIIQAPMAGVSSPDMAAAVANTGGLGSIGVGATNAAGTRTMIAAVRERTNRSFNVNLFCHRPAAPDTTIDAAWIERLRPEFERLGAEPPAALAPIYKSFLEDDDMLAALLEERPPVVSFHFGVPALDRIRALRDAGIVLLGSATSLAEARAVVAAGADAVVAQGYEAGGHRAVFDPDANDDRLGTLALTRLLVRNLDVPVIAAGGIMDGAGIAAALALGAQAAQLGTAFVACPETSIDDGYRRAMLGESARHTTFTKAISGRVARSMVNRFTELEDHVGAPQPPAYPIAYDAGKALHAAAKAKGEFGYGAQWAGQAAALARSLPAAELFAQLESELRESIRQLQQVGG